MKKISTYFCTLWLIECWFAVGVFQREIDSCYPIHTTKPKVNGQWQLQMTIFRNNSCKCTFPFISKGINRSVTQAFVHGKNKGRLRSQQMINQQQKRGDPKKRNHFSGRIRSLTASKVQGSGEIHHKRRKHRNNESSRPFQQAVKFVELFLVVDLIEY